MLTSLAALFNPRTRRSANMKNTKLNPNFNHRLFDLGREVSPRTLSSDIDTMTHLAESTLNLIASQFVDLPEDDKVSRMPDETMYWAIENVMQTIRDIRATVHAYDESSRQAAR
jgi:hypothetical protein